MSSDFLQQLGDFAVFGFSKPSASPVRNKLHAWGATPQTIEFGQAGHFYFYSTYGDVAETDQTLGLKLGFARTPGLTALSTAALLSQKLLTPQDIQPDNIRGNAVIAAVSKTSPELSVYQTIFATPQLFYSASEGEIVCSNSLRCLVNLLDRVELDEERLPAHFMFQLVPGPLTYYKNVYRLFPGQKLHWKAGKLDVRYVKDLQFADSRQQITKVDQNTPSLIYERIRDVVNVYIDDAAQAGQRVENLLSGGVDSAILQLALNERQNGAGPPTTYSYAVRVPGFQFEVEYAQEASKILGTDHIIADIQPNDFPEMIKRAVEAVAQPIPGEADACKIMMAEFLASRPKSARFFLSGQVADALYGMGLARKIAIFNLVHKIPASEFALNSIAALVKPGSARLADGLQSVAQSLAATQDPTAYGAWHNVICTYANLPIARRSFGDEALHRALDYRLSLQEQYRASENLTEKLHLIDMLTEGYEPAMFSGQMFLTHHKEQIYPYLDEDVIRLAFSIKPDIRFVKPGLGFLDQNNTKYLLKDILVQKSCAPIALKRKGASAFDTDLFRMMKSGELREMTQAIERPAFLSKADFEALLEKPDHFLWNLLSFDTFKKHVLKPLQKSRTEK
ncbi:MAG: asparagine synthase-related protein [Anaerolineae bacterium]|nr:asparagine synthase-related protein [Anaerolineae bacterium]